MSLPSGVEKAAAAERLTLDTRALAYQLVLAHIRTPRDFAAQENLEDQVLAHEDPQLAVSAVAGVAALLARFYADARGVTVEEIADELEQVDAAVRLLR